MLAAVHNRLHEISGLGLLELPQHSGSPRWLEIPSLLTYISFSITGSVVHFYAAGGAAAAAPAGGAALAPAGTGVAEGTPGCGRGYPYAPYPPKLNGLYGL